jgi:Spy/CpxP family protein refolding chaperone
MRMLAGSVRSLAVVSLALMVPSLDRPVHAGDSLSPEADGRPELTVEMACPSTLPGGPTEQAHGKPSKWWISEEGRREFGLSDAQSRDLEAVFQSVVPTLKAQKVDVDRYQKELSALLGDVKAREADVVMAVDRLEKAQSALSKTRTLMLFRMYRLLTPEQRAKVQAHYDQRARESETKDGRR